MGFFFIIVIYINYLESNVKCLVYNFVVIGRFKKKEEEEECSCIIEKKKNNWYNEMCRMISLM